jgi:hypothetical protein
MSHIEKQIAILEAEIMFNTECIRAMKDIIYSICTPEQKAQLSAAIVKASEEKISTLSIIKY